MNQAALFVAFVESMEVAGDVSREAHVLRVSTRAPRSIGDGEVNLSFEVREASSAVAVDVPCVLAGVEFHTGQKKITIDVDEVGHETKKRALGGFWSMAMCAFSNPEVAAKWCHDKYNVEPVLHIGPDGPRHVEHCWW